MYRSGTVMAWNVFRFCTALRGLGSIMILLVLGVVGVTYYAVVLTSYGPSLVSGSGILDALIALAVLVLFHCLVNFLTSIVLGIPLLIIGLQWVERNFYVCGVCEEIGKNVLFGCFI